MITLFQLNKVKTKCHAQMQQKTSLKMIKTTTGVRKQTNKNKNS